MKIDDNGNGRIAYIYKCWMIEEDPNCLKQFYTTSPINDPVSRRWMQRSFPWEQWKGGTGFGHEPTEPEGIKKERAPEPEPEEPPGVYLVTPLLVAGPHAHRIIEVVGGTDPIYARTRIRIGDLERQSTKSTTAKKQLPDCRLVGDMDRGRVVCACRSCGPASPNMSCLHSLDCVSKGKHLLLIQVEYTGMAAWCALSRV